MDDNDAAEEVSRWTCEACGCNTNTESSNSQSCAICGTRRATAARFLIRGGRSSASRLLAHRISRRFASYDHSGEDGENDEEEDAAVNEQDEDDLGNTVQAFEPAESTGVTRSRPSRTSHISHSAPDLPTPAELLATALDSSGIHKPKWNDQSSPKGSHQTLGNEIIVNDSGTVAHVPHHGGEGRAIRSQTALSRSEPGVVGFRVAFRHPSRKIGRSMGGCYLVGLTTAAFSAYGQRSCLQQSKYFWGIEDAGRKYEGTGLSRTSLPSRGHGIQLSRSDVPRNKDNVLFGSEEVVTVVADLRNRTLTYWRGDQLLGTLVSNIPSTGSLYPVVVPFNAGVSVAITSVDGDPLTILSAHEVAQERSRELEDAARRVKLAQQWDLLIQGDRPSPKLLSTLRTICSWYADANDSGQRMSFTSAARLWYRCGIRLSHLLSVLEEGHEYFVTIDDFLAVMTSVTEDEVARRARRDSESCFQDSGTDEFQVGDSVELIQGYHMYGDASRGPLRPGDRGSVVQVDNGTKIDRQSVRVLFNGRRWWYQPRALVSENSGLQEAPVIRFFHGILRSHGYNPCTLQSLSGKPVSPQTWQEGDLVAPICLSRKRKTPGNREKWESSSRLGRIVTKKSQDKSSFTKEESDVVAVEFIDAQFCISAGALSGSSSHETGSSQLQVRSIRFDRLAHMSFYNDGWNIKLPTFQLKSEHIDSKVKAWISCIAELDKDAITSVTRECEESDVSLAGLFSDGLDNAILAATDKVLRTCSESGDGSKSETSTDVLASLGALTLVVVDELFTEYPKDDNRRTPRTEQSSSADSSHRLNDNSTTTENVVTDTPTVQESNVSILASIGREDQERDTITESVNMRGLIRDLQQAGHSDSQSRSRNILIALMAGTRARGQNNSASDHSGTILNRDTEANTGENRRDLPVSLRNPETQTEITARRYSASNHGSAAPHTNGLSAPFLSSRTSSGSTDSSRNLPSIGFKMPRGSRKLEEKQANAPPLLETLWRGHNRESNRRQLPSSQTAHAASISSLIDMGLLQNCACWVEASLAERICKNPSSVSKEKLVDEEGTSLLILAIIFGCSESIISSLIRAGSRVGEEEVKLAAKHNQADVLSIILQNSVYKIGTLDLSQYSPEVVTVVNAAAGRQALQETKMREKSASFVSSLLTKLMSLGLQFRQRDKEAKNSADTVMKILIGDSLTEWPCFVPGESQQHEAHLWANRQNVDALRVASIRSPTSERGQSSSTFSGLLSVIPVPVLRQIICEAYNKTSHGKSFLSIYLQLMESYLWCKTVNEAIVGLKLASVLVYLNLEKPAKHEIERYGLAVLAEEHVRHARERLTKLKENQKLNAVRDTKGTVTPGVILCPRQHVATLHLTRHSSFRCDLCGRGVERGKPMHGCRECDWDGCEDCTDMVEGGKIKWSLVQRLGTYLLETMSSLRETGLCHGDRDLNPLVGNTRLEEVARLIFQRDVAAWHLLQKMLDEPGVVTMYEFSFVVIPLVHGIICGEHPSEQRKRNDRTPCHDAVNRGRRHKKQRSASIGSQKQIIASESQDQKSFLRTLVHTTYGHCAKSTKDDRAPAKFRAQKQAEEYGENSDTPGTECRSEDDSSEEECTDQLDSIANHPGSAILPTKSEIVRRTQKTLTFFENAEVLRHTRGDFSVPINAKAGEPGDLRSLTKPIQIELVPSTAGQSDISQNHRSLVVEVEPLTRMTELKLQLLRTYKIRNQAYTEYCRSLAEESATLAECDYSRNCVSAMGDARELRAYRVLEFDEDSGVHKVQYASSPIMETRTGLFHLRLNELRFDGDIVFLILAMRDYRILYTKAPFHEPSSLLKKSRVTPEYQFSRQVECEYGNGSDFCSDCDPYDEPRMDADFLSMPLTVGTRVQSHTHRSSGLKNTSTIRAVTKGGAESRFTYMLVSESGEVSQFVPPSKILDHDAELLHCQREEDSGGRLNMVSSEVQSPPRPGVLKRKWSAVSLPQEMNPLDLCISGGTRSTNGHSNAPTGKESFIQYETLPLPPFLDAGFSVIEKVSAVPDAALSGMTVYGALCHMRERDQQTGDWRLSRSRDAGYKLFFSFFLRAGELSSNLAPLNPKSLFGCRSTYIDLGPDSFNELSAGSRGSRGETGADDSFFQDTGFGKQIQHKNQDNWLCAGVNYQCFQCVEILSFLSHLSSNCLTAINSAPKEGVKLEIQTNNKSCFESDSLTTKLIEQLHDPLAVVCGVLPEWCLTLPLLAPCIFSHSARLLLLERTAFGVSRAALKQQEAKIACGGLRRRMAALRARAVELVGEAFSGRAADPTALQLQADELYGMEEALAARVKAVFRAHQWEERSLECAKGAVRREKLLLDASSLMELYASDPRVCSRRLEVRFEGESGFDAASGDQAGVTRGFYADVAETLLSCEIVSGVNCDTKRFEEAAVPCTGRMTDGVNSFGRTPLWVPDMDSRQLVIIPTPRADPKSVPGVYPRPITPQNPHFDTVMIHFRFMGRLFAASMRDSFIFPLPLSISFIKLVQSHIFEHEILKYASILSPVEGKKVRKRQKSALEVSTKNEARKCLSSFDLPRPGFLAGEVFAVEQHICQKLDKLDEEILSDAERERRRNNIASDESFARTAFGRTYDCSFDEYFAERRFVDPLDPTQGENAVSLCAKGHLRKVTINNVREWVELAKKFILHDGVIAQAISFKEGINDFFPCEYLCLFTAKELLQDVCGGGDNVARWDESTIRALLKLDGGKGAAEALVAVAAIGGEGGAALSHRFGPSSPTITYLVKALLEASSIQRRQFLSFVTSVPIVTPGKIEVVPIVNPSGDFLPMADPTCLPRANTCARKLYLPKFESFECLSEVLWSVVREECRFKGFFEWNG